MRLKGEWGGIRQVEMHLHAAVAIPPYVVARRYEKGRVRGRMIGNDPRGTKTRNYSSPLLSRAAYILSCTSSGRAGVSACGGQMRTIHTG
jgi:hypothetical protein